MICPFQGETTLSGIVDSTQPTQLKEKIKAFKATLSLEQRRSFNEIDDLFVSHVTGTQHATIKMIHCPTCRKHKGNGS